MSDIIDELDSQKAGWRTGCAGRTLFALKRSLGEAATKLSFKRIGLRHLAIDGAVKLSSEHSNDADIRSVLFGPTSLDQISAQWLRADAPDLLMTSPELESILGTACAGGAKLVLALSHDDYTSIPGGLQFCVQREEEQVRLRGGVYLNLHPFQPLPRLAKADKGADFSVNLVLNGSALATCRMSSLIQVIQRISAMQIPVEIIIHHLLGFLPEQVSTLIAATGSKKCFFWLHDFFSLCPNYLLQRNNKAFCNAPKPQSNACGVCLYGLERRDHLARICMFFERNEVHVISPSEVALSLWSDRANFPIAAKYIVPHSHLIWAERSIERSSAAFASPITIGFLGQPADHKGWPVFERLAAALKSDKSVRFVVMGVKKPVNKKMKWTKVNTTAANPTAMAYAVAQEKLDIVLHWPSWPETFSLATHEGIEGGAFIVTNDASGNVAKIVEETGCGVVLKDEASLLVFFESGAAIDLAQAARLRRQGTTVSRQLSEMTVPLLFGAR